MAKYAPDKPVILTKKSLARKGDLALATAKLSIREILEKRQTDAGDDTKPEIAIEVIEKIFSSESFEIKLQPKTGEKHGYLVYSNVLSDRTGALSGA